MFAGTLLNFAAFWTIHAIYLDGDAWNGGIHDGQYILSANGKYYMTSAWVWFYSLTHTWISFMSIFLLFLIPEIRGQFQTQDGTSSE
ncbi:MAG: hypothetical protein AAGH68_02090 [Pseudomonadota bacterium]